MPTYLPADVKSLRYSEDPTDANPVFVDVNFIDPSAFSITETSVRQPVNHRKQVTAIKDVSVDILLFDHALLTSLRTLEQAFTEIAWELTLLDGTTILTKVAPISIDREVAQSDGLQGYQILSNYGEGYGTTPVTDTYPV